MTVRPVQSRTASLAEAVMNVAVGYLVALVAQRLVYPAYDIHTTLATDSAIAGLFTMLSLARSFVLRRLFERLRG